MQGRPTLAPRCNRSFIFACYYVSPPAQTDRIAHAPAPSPPLRSIHCCLLAGGVVAIASRTAAQRRPVRGRRLALRDGQPAKRAGNGGGPRAGRGLQEQPFAVSN